MSECARRTQLLGLLALCAVLFGQHARACVATSTAEIDLGTRTSFEVGTPLSNAGSGGSGLTCAGLLGLLTSQYIFLSVDDMSTGLVNPVSGDSIPFSVATLPAGVPIVPGGTSGNLASGSLLSLGGVNGEVQFFVSLGAAGNVSSGTYTGTITLRWHFATCGNLGAAGACALGPWTTSPGITQSCVLGILCTVTTASLPGPGVAVQVTIKLEVTRDCRFDADDIDFGSAPFADGFTPVSGALQVTCTKGTTYSVGLSDGNYFSAGRRRMASGANRLQYDVFLPGGVRWNDSTQRAEQPLPAQGNLPETFIYEARVYSDQPTPPAGDYQDVLVIDVAF
jgi:spore coat protein U-like protein